MPCYVERFWESDFARGELGRRARGYAYRAYVPDPIASFTLAIPFDVAAEMEAVAQDITQLQDLAPIFGLEALSQQLLRAESVGSSRIEGLQLSQRRLARADLDPGAGNELARAVMGNVRAMAGAVALAQRATPLDVAAIQSLHRLLMEGTRDASIAGKLRTTQNWIGGRDDGPEKAEFVPPPEDLVTGLLEDLCVFLAREDVPGILQAAIAHAQFETIHPFADGNGRVGRALLHAVLRRRNITPRFVPPVSLVLAANAGRYVDGLTAFRQGDALTWCRTFIRTLQAATERAKRFHEQLDELQRSWRELAGTPRAGSATDRLIALLPAHPVLNGELARDVLASSDVAARNALNELEAAGILRQVSIGKRNRVWEATELLHLVDEFEWNLATPTKAGAARRASPPRKQT